MLASDGDALDPARAPTDLDPGAPLTSDGLRAALESLQLSGAELAALLGLEDRALRRYEQGEPIPRSIEIVVKLMLSGRTSAAELAGL